MSETNIAFSADCSEINQGRRHFAKILGATTLALQFGRYSLAEEPPGVVGAVSKTADVNGIRMHYVEMGEGPLVLLCHGFPESWYSWRHQIPALAAAGYRVIAPDLRGYGKTESPKEVARYTINELVNDLIGLIEIAKVKSSFIVGHDFGAVLAWNAALLHPERFTAVAALSVPYSPRRDVAPVANMRSLARDNFFYIVHFQEVGVADAEMDSQPEKHLRAFYYTYSFEGEIARQRLRLMPRNSRLIDTIVDPGRSPAWMTDVDFAIYVAAFKQSGFTGPLNWYRNLDRNWELMTAYKNAKILVPAVFISGERDPVRAQTLQNYNDLEANVPKLTKKVAIPACGHWTQQEKPAETTAAILDFLKTVSA